MMRFTIPQETLASMIEHVGSVVPSRPDVPAQGALRLAVEDDRLTVEAVGPDGGLSRAWVDDMDGEGGEAFVRYEWMAAAVKALPHVDVTVRADETVMRVSAGGSRMTLRLMPDVTELEPHAEPDEPAVSLDTAAWRAALRLTRPITRAATSRSNPVLVGVHLRAVGDALRMEASDMYRVARALVSVHADDGAPAGPMPDVDLICPADRLEVAADAEAASLGFSGRTATVRTGSTLDVAVLVDGIFPSFDRILPSSFTSTVDLPVDEFKGALSRALLVAGQTSAPVKLASDGDGVHMSLTNEDEEMQSSDVIEAELDGDPFTVLLDPRYVSHAITVASGPTVRLGRNEAKKVVEFRDPENEGMLVGIQTRIY